MTYRAELCGLVALAVLSCRSREEIGQAPPEVITPKAGEAALCASTPSAFTHADLREVLAPRVADFCQDPNSKPRAYGQDGEGNMDEVCTELFNGECESYKGYGLLRVTTARFVRGDGSPAMVSANVSRFSGADGALAFYSRRVLGDQDPKAVNLRTIPGLNYAALGAGVAYAQTGPLVVELVYVNENEPPAAIRAVSDQLLPQFLATITATEGANTPPPAVTALPQQHRLTFGVVMEPKNGFGVSGLGPVATGYYEESGKRYRIAVSESASESSSKDIYAGVRRLPGRHLLKEAPLEAFEVRQWEPDGPDVWWLVGKHGNRVAAVIDEVWARRGATPDEQTRLSLDRAGKFEVLRRVLRAK
jgi:hypothetical protein